MCILKTPSVISYPFKFDCISKIPCTLINVKFYRQPFVSKLWHGICAVFAHVYLQFANCMGFYPMYMTIFSSYAHSTHMYQKRTPVLPYIQYAPSKSPYICVLHKCAYTCGSFTLLNMFNEHCIISWASTYFMYDNWKATLKENEDGASREGIVRSHAHSCCKFTNS